MKSLVLVSMFLSSLTCMAKDYVTISKSILINEKIEDVYIHVSNTLNDDTWRTEVNDMQADGAFEVGTTFTEDAHIGLRKNFITKTVLMELIENKKAFYQTPLDAKYFLSSLREVEVVSESKTRFTYTVVFDRAMSRETLGANLPSGLLEFSYGLIMKGYLRNLAELFD